MAEVRAIREEEEKKKRHPSKLNDHSIEKLLPHRNPNGNKGTFGKVLVIAGSRNMAGAAILSARAALSSGCGMVMVLTDECNRVILQTAVPEALLATYDGVIDEEVVYNAYDWATTVLIGPGLSVSEEAKELVDFILSMEDNKPVVMDADALNILSEEVTTHRLANKSVIVTPHVGEMGRLVDLPISEIKAHRIETAEAFSAHHGVTIVLKDAVSVISSPGRRTFENHSGNSGMATAGSGDVLSGIIASLVAQGMNNSEAAVLGTYIHGRAGDFAAEAVGEYCMTAQTIIEHLPDVFALAKKRG